jgi:hypothetical protein
VLAKLDEVRNIVFIDNDDACLYLYQHFNWNLEKMVDFFSQDWIAFKKHAEGFDPSRLLKEGKKGTCVVCLEEGQLFSSGMCPHSYCRDCWKGYIRS